MAASAEPKTRQLYEFGPFRLDPDRELLLREDESVPIAPKAFQILLVLVRQNKQVVTKDDLMKTIWPDTFVEEANLSRNIFLLRKALGESPQDHQYIVTVPGRGYRFAEDVQLVPDREVNVVVASHASVEVQVEATQPWGWIAAAVLLAALAAGSVALFSLHRRPASASQAKIMLAVLPFENLTGDAANEYVSDGLTEEMITQLAELQPERLGVIARTSVMHFKHANRDIQRVADQLGVQFILEGSLRESSEHMRITAQLIQVKDQTHLWAQEYDRSPGDVLTLEREVAGEIARVIQLKLAPVSQQNLTQQRPIDPEAHALYLRGRFAWNKRTPDSFNESVGYFEGAIRKDPNYADAYVGLADAYRFLMGIRPPMEVLPQARAAAEKALALDPSLAEAHASMGLIVPSFDWDWESARKHFERAIQLNQNNATVHQWYAEGYLSPMGRMDESLAELRVAQHLDPLSCPVAADIGKTLYFARRYDEAEAQFRGVLASDTNCYPAYVWLRMLYQETGRYAQALELFDKEKTFNHSEIDNQCILAGIYARMGRTEEARQLLAQTVRIAQKQHVDPGQIAAEYINLGDKDQAFAWLEKAYTERSYFMSSLRVWGLYDPIRTDPRFIDLERRVRLIP